MNTENSEPYILVLSCFYHDSAACLLEGGNIVAAAQEERFSRKNAIPDSLNTRLNKEPIVKP